MQADTSGRLINYIFYTIFHIYKKQNNPDDEDIIWETCYLVGCENLTLAHAQIRKFFKDNCISKTQKLKINGKDGYLKYRGIRQVVECGDPFLWSHLENNSVAELGYVEYSIKHKHVKKLVSGKEVKVTLAKVDGRKMKSFK